MSTVTYKTGPSTLSRKDTCEYRGRKGPHVKVEITSVPRGPKTDEYPLGLPCTEAYGWKRHYCVCCCEVLQWERVSIEREEDDDENHH